MCGNLAKLKIKKKKKNNNGTFKESIRTPDTSTHVKKRDVLQRSQMVPLLKYQFYFVRKFQWYIYLQYLHWKRLWDRFIENVQETLKRKFFL